MAVMNEMNGPGLTISCDDCSMRCTSACDDCVVTFLLSGDEATEPTGPDVMVLDLDQARVVTLLGKAGLVPGLKYRVAG
jgi:hypothetical protein